MWHDLLAAFGLMLVVEGILPFLSPRGIRQALLQMMRLDDNVLRLTGLGSMLIGLVVLYLVRGL
jgi:uncharacterized protein YjeT (DUF2065 family)